MKNALESEGFAREFVHYLIDIAEASLRAPDDVLSPEAKRELLIGLKGIKTEHGSGAFDQLVQICIDPIRQGRPDEADHLYHQLWRLMGAAFLIGSRGVKSPDAEAQGMALASKPLQDGGRKGGSVKPKKPWHPRAIELAAHAEQKLQRKKGKPPSRSAIATEVLTYWKHDEECPVGYERMCDFLRDQGFPHGLSTEAPSVPD